MQRLECFGRRPLGNLCTFAKEASNGTAAWKPSSADAAAPQRAGRAIRQANFSANRDPEITGSPMGISLVSSKKKSHNM